MGLVRFAAVVAVLLGGVWPGYAQAPVGADARAELSRHLSLAQQYLGQRQPAKAIPELRAALAMDPANVEVRANLGVLLFFQGQFAEAEPELRAAVNAQAGLTKIVALLGIAERRNGHEVAGREDLLAAFPSIADEKLKLDVGRELIDSYTSTEDLERAAEVCATLLKMKPADPALLYTNYRLHHDLAVQSLVELSVAAPKSGQMHQAMAHELEQEHDLPGVIRNLRAALAADANLPGIHFELAEALHASDDERLRGESLGEYKLAVQTAPRDAKAATRLADLYAERNDAADAQKLYEQALASQPGYPDAEIGEANLMQQRGDAAGAARLLEQVVAEDPTNSLAHFRLSVVYRKLKRPEDVKRELALYQKYKDEREGLQALYKSMRTAPAEGAK